MQVTVFDYGAGNLHSVNKALTRLGATVRTETDSSRLTGRGVLVLPGVGSFALAASRLEPGRIALQTAIAEGMPCLGICLGMQLLFDDSEEGIGRGLGIIPGHVRRLGGRRVPHIGWNSLDANSDPTLRRARLDIAYYANSYVCEPRDTADVVAWSSVDERRIAAVVRRGTAIGVQFHPEKSSEPGIRYLGALLEDLAA